MVMNISTTTHNIQDFIQRTALPPVTFGHCLKHSIRTGRAHVCADGKCEINQFSCSTASYVYCAEIGGGRFRCQEGYCVVDERECMRPCGFESLYMTEKFGRIKMRKRSYNKTCPGYVDKCVSDEFQCHGNDDIYDIPMYEDSSLKIGPWISLVVVLSLLLVVVCCVAAERRRCRPRTELARTQSSVSRRAPSGAALLALSRPGYPPGYTPGYSPGYTPGYPADYNDLAEQNSPVAFSLIPVAKMTDSVTSLA